MTDHDFTCGDHGTTATITTNNWKTTQWGRTNVPDAAGYVTGGTYATIVGEPRQMLDIAMALIEAGFTCPNHELIQCSGTA